MEKQPVDDLFARKLRDAEAPVGPDIFAQLQKRMDTKPLPVRRPMAAWWYITSAACILIALLFVYVTNPPSEKANRPIAHKQPLKKAADREAEKTAVAIAPSSKQQNGGNNDQASNTEKLLTKVTYPDRRPVAPKGESIVNESTLTQSQPTEQIAVIRSSEIQQKTEEQPTGMKPATPVDRIERVGNKQKQTTERTIVLTIEEPQLTNALATTQSDLPAPDLQVHKNGLPGLLSKLRQLKNGEVLARATPVVSSQNTQKNRLGRVFSEVKESLKNETTLE